MSIDCIHYGYEGSQTQPQLFVTSDFKVLSNVLKEFSGTMATKGGESRDLKKQKLRRP
ncbi:MAG: hypothetical protein Ct9H300mP9_2420 [Candidatus Neomarinimicrobiota bacterium]|nr:MAG: hypothetical protein Ct9H300mP9_2420 [Candidatus Neomarinimicrobiota bacterium]